jgi:hypothetical protein
VEKDKKETNKTRAWERGGNKLVEADKLATKANLNEGLEHEWMELSNCSKWFSSF